MSIPALLLYPLGPAVVLGLGGVLIALSRWVIRDPLPASGAASPPDSHDSFGRPGLRLPLRALFALAVALAALALLLYLRVRPGHPILTWSWQPLTVAGSVLYWELDGWNWLASLLVLLLTVTALVMGELGEDLLPAGFWPGRQAERTLWLGAAALCFVCSGNVVTLASAWVLLDLGLLLRLHPGEAVEPAARVWSLLSLTILVLPAALLLLGEPNVRVSLAQGPFAPIVLALLWIAALARAGIYPFHSWLVGPGHTDAGGRVALHLLGPLTGLWLLGRVNAFSGADWLRRPEWAALGALALLGTALVAWTSDDETVRWRWIALNRASLMLLAMYMMAATGAQAQVWLLSAFALACALLLTGMVVRRRYGWRWLLVVAALAVWGVPGAPGFLVRWVLVFPTSLSVAVPLFALLLISEALLVAALWQLIAGCPGPEGSSADPNRASRQSAADPDAQPARFGWLMPLGLGVVLCLLAVPLLYAGLLPQQWATATRHAADGSISPLPSILLQARRSVWIGLVLAGVGGLALGLLRARIFSRMRGWQMGIANVVSLEWLYRGIAGVLALAGAGLRYFSMLGEGEGYVGWLLLAGAILWLLLRG
jgi:hypothetical protein